MSSCLRCGNPRAFRGAGDCGHEHLICTKCESEWCSLYKEWEQLGSKPGKRRIKQEKKADVKEESTKKRKGENGREREVFDILIMEAAGALGDYMGEYADGQYEEKGGAEGLVEGRVELKPDEIKECMFEALNTLRYSAVKRKKIDLDSLNIDRSKLVDYWYRRDFK